MSNDTPTDRVVIAAVERIAIAVESTIRNNTQPTTRLTALIQWTAQRLSKLFGTCRS
jgi:hypothetical protein